MDLLKLRNDENIIKCIKEIVLRIYLYLLFIFKK